MSKQYFTKTIFNQNVVWYEENGFRISFIDPSPGNTEYQEYLKWVSEGNVAEEITNGN
jgi:hypothetical protein